MKTWLAEHTIRAHIVGPLWACIPEKTRWHIVTWLNRSPDRCWCDLVDAALCWHRERDACDIPTPLGSDKGARCKSVCDWSHSDHVGEHDCACYCGKFQFLAPEGAIDRKATR